MKKIYFFLSLSLLVLSATAAPNPIFQDSVPTIQLMRMNLYGYNADGTTFRIDGAMTQYGDSYSNDIDGEDGRKMINPGINVCLLRDNINLVVERRHTIASSDTSFYNIWGLQHTFYLMRFVGVNLNQQGLTAFMEDKYLHTSTPVSLNDTTDIKIEINNDPASSLTDRFRLIFKKDLDPVIHFTALAGQQVLLKWSGTNNANINKYWIQRSSNGSDFSDIGMVNARYSDFGNYQWVDPFPSDGINSYRIKALQVNGQIEISEIVTTKFSTIFSDGILIFPNPASIENLNLKMINQPNGKYVVRIFNSFGRIVTQHSFEFAGGNGTEKISSNQSLIPGIYHLQILKPTGKQQILEVVF